MCTPQPEQPEGSSLDGCLNLEGGGSENDEKADNRPQAIVIRRPQASGFLTSPRRRQPTPSKNPWGQERYMVFRDSPMASLQPSDIFKNINFTISESVLRNPHLDSHTPNAATSNSCVMSRPEFRNNSVQGGSTIANDISRPEESSSLSHHGWRPTVKRSLLKEVETLETIENCHDNFYKLSKINCVALKSSSLEERVEAVNESGDTTASTTVTDIKVTARTTTPNTTSIDTSGDMNVPVWNFGDVHLKNCSIVLQDIQVGNDQAISTTQENGMEVNTMVTNDLYTSDSVCPTGGNDANSLPDENNKKDNIEMKTLKISSAAQDENLLQIQETDVNLEDLQELEEIISVPGIADRVKTRTRRSVCVVKSEKIDSEEDKATTADNPNNHMPASLPPQDNAAVPSNRTAMSNEVVNEAFVSFSHTKSRQFEPEPMVQRSKSSERLLAKGNGGGGGVTSQKILRQSHIAPSNSEIERQMHDDEENSQITGSNSKPNSKPEELKELSEQIVKKTDRVFETGRICSKSNPSETSKETKGLADCSTTRVSSLRSSQRRTPNREAKSKEVPIIDSNIPTPVCHVDYHTKDVKQFGYKFIHSENVENTVAVIENKLEANTEATDLQLSCKSEIKPEPSDESNDDINNKGHMISKASPVSSELSVAMSIRHNMRQCRLFVHEGMYRESMAIIPNDVPVRQRRMSTPSKHSSVSLGFKRNPLVTVSADECDADNSNNDAEDGFSSNNLGKSRRISSISKKASSKRKSYQREIRHCVDWNEKNNCVNSKREETINITLEVSEALSDEDLIVTPNIAERVKDRRACTQFNHEGQYANGGEGPEVLTFKSATEIAKERRILKAKKRLCYSNNCIDHDKILSKDLSDVSCLFNAPTAHENGNSTLLRAPGTLESENGSGSNSQASQSPEKIKRNSCSSHKSSGSSAVVVRRSKHSMNSLSRGDANWCKYLSDKDWSQHESDVETESYQVNESTGNDTEAYSFPNQQAPIASPNKKQTVSSAIPEECEMKPVLKPSIVSTNDVLLPCKDDKSRRHKIVQSSPPPPKSEIPDDGFSVLRENQSKRKSGGRSKKKSRLSLRNRGDQILPSPLRKIQEFQQPSSPISSNNLLQMGSPRLRLRIQKNPIDESYSSTLEELHDDGQNLSYREISTFCQQQLESSNRTPNKQTKMACNIDSPVAPSSSWRLQSTSANDELNSVIQNSLSSLKKNEKGSFGDDKDTNASDNNNKAVMRKGWATRGQSHSNAVAPSSKARSRCSRNSKRKRKSSTDGDGFSNDNNHILHDLPVGSPNKQFDESTNVSRLTNNQDWQHMLTRLHGSKSTARLGIDDENELDQQQVCRSSEGSKCHTAGSVRDSDKRKKRCLDQKSNSKHGGKRERSLSISERDTASPSNKRRRKISLGTTDGCDDDYIDDDNDTLNETMSFDDVHNSFNTNNVADKVATGDSLQTIESGRVEGDNSGLESTPKRRRRNFHHSHFSVNSNDTHTKRQFEEQACLSAKVCRNGNSNNNIDNTSTKDVSEDNRLVENISAAGGPVNPNLGDLLNYVPMFSSPAKTNSSWDDAFDSYLNTSCKTDNQSQSFVSPHQLTPSRARASSFSPFSMVNSNYNNSPVTFSLSPTSRGAKSPKRTPKKSSMVTDSSQSIARNFVPVDVQSPFPSPNKRRLNGPSNSNPNSNLRGVGPGSPAVEKIDSVISFNHMSPQRLQFSPIKCNKSTSHRRNLNLVPNNL